MAKDNNSGLLTAKEQYYKQLKEWEESKKSNPNKPFPLEAFKKQFAQENQNESILPILPGGLGEPRPTTTAQLRSDFKKFGMESAAVKHLAHLAIRSEYPELPFPSEKFKQELAKWEAKKKNDPQIPFPKLNTKVREWQKSEFSKLLKSKIKAKSLEQFVNKLYFTHSAREAEIERQRSARAAREKRVEALKELIGMPAQKAAARVEARKELERAAKAAAEKDVAEKAAAKETAEKLKQQVKEEVKARKPVSPKYPDVPDAPSFLLLKKIVNTVSGGEWYKGEINKYENYKQELNKYYQEEKLYNQQLEKYQYLQELAAGSSPELQNAIANYDKAHPSKVKQTQILQANIEPVKHSSEPPETASKTTDATPYVAPDSKLPPEIVMLREKINQSLKERGEELKQRETSETPPFLFFKKIANLVSGGSWYKEEVNKYENYRQEKSNYDLQMNEYQKVQQQYPIDIEAYIKALETYTSEYQSTKKPDLPQNADKTMANKILATPEEIELIAETLKDNKGRNNKENQNNKHFKNNKETSKEGTNKLATKTIKKGTGRLSNQSKTDLKLKAAIKKIGFKDMMATAKEARLTTIKGVNGKKTERVRGI